MGDPLAGKYHNHYAGEFDLACALFRQLPFEGKLEWSKNDYEAFVYKSPLVSLIFYPHKVRGTGNYHIRIRDHGSKDKALMEFISAYLDYGSGFNRTFSSLNKCAVYWSDGLKKYLADKPELRVLMEDLGALHKAHEKA